ncbi:phytoene/squalene synthase family protein [Pseudomonadota bacterium]
MMEELQFPNRATEPGSRHYYCVRIAPASTHNDLALLFLWRQELRDILYRCSDPGVAHAKLKWYREELERAMEGKAQQPLAQALGEVIHRRQLPVQPFHRMTDALEADLSQTWYDQMDSLHDYCRLDGGSLLQLVTQVCGGDEAEADCAEGLGAFIRLVDIIRNLGPGMARGCRHLPKSELGEAGLSLADTTKADNQEKLGILLKGMGAHALEWQASTLSSLPKGSHPALTPALSLATMNQALLAELNGSGFPVMNQRVCLTPLRKIWITWRSSHRAKKWT